MKVLVTYLTKTGNTKKVAEAIYSAVGTEKEIKPIAEVNDLGGYDVAFLGFPMHQFGPDKKSVELMKKHCVAGRNVAIFVTHAAPEGEPGLPDWLDKFRKASSGANIVGFFDCQGELSAGTKAIMYMMPSLRAMAKRDNSKGQPDAARLERARAFAKDVVSKSKG